MSSSDSGEPVPKKVRLSTVNDLKRHTSPEDAVENIKRLRLSTEEPMDQESGRMEVEETVLAAQRREHFLTVCESVSYGHFSDHKRRFLLCYPPHCSLQECEHKTRKESYLEIANYAKETFRIDYKSQMWCEALHVCEMTLRPDSFLPSDIMLDIIEIIMNVHADPYAGYSTSHILNRCLQTIYLMYRTHPPCSPIIRKCYKLFLTSPLTVNHESLSDRSKYECEKGLVKYCLNRLEYELRSESKDGPLIDKSEHLTEEMKKSIRGLHWQKEKLEIFETLERAERIQRLMVVLKCVVEILTADLSIWLSRHIHNQGTHIMRSHRPLLSIILWSDKILYTGAVNNNCRQIISIFVKVVQLGFPEDDIQILTQLLNAMVQTFYMCEINSDGDYPHVGKYCAKFANEVFSKIKDLQLKSKIKVLSRIQPSFMRYSVSMICTNNVLQSEDENILSLLATFMNRKLWLKYDTDSTSLYNEDDKFEPANKPLRICTGFSKCMKFCKPVQDDIVYRKDHEINEMESIKQEDVIKLLLVALDAYLNMYSMDKIQKHLSNPNVTLSAENHKLSAYTLSEEFYKKYRAICKEITELKSIFKSLKGNNILELFKGYSSLSLLGL